MKIAIITFITLLVSALVITLFLLNLLYRDTKLRLERYKELYEYELDLNKRSEIARKQGRI